MQITPTEVINLRTKLQTKMQCGITEAQKQCATLIYTSLRSWQQWERGERRMHPAMYELADVKVRGLLGG